MINNLKISIFLPDLRGGGAERVALNLTDEFISRNFSVDLVLLKSGGVLLSELNPKVRIIDLGVSRIRNCIFPLARYLKRERPEAMIANMWPLTGIAVVSRCISRHYFNLMVVEHINWSMSLKSYSKSFEFILKHGMKLLFPKADSVVVVSNGAAEDLARLCSLERSRIATIYNPIVRNDDIHIESIKDLLWSQGTHLKIIAIGSFKAQKNFPALLNAFAIVCKKVDARLLILGEGDDRYALEKQISQLGLTGKVLLPGFVVNPLVYLRQADLFVLSSDYEGFGNVLVEALHAGTPIVSTDCPSGPREILEDGKYGTLVPVGDAEALAQAIYESLSKVHNKEVLMSRAQDFTVSKAADEYLALLFPGITMPKISVR